MTTDSGIHVDAATLVQLEERTLDGDTRARVLSHLETCGRCQAELALVWSYRKVPADARLAGGHSERLTASFCQRLQERAGLEGQAPPLRRRPRRPRLGPIRLPGSGRDWMVGGLVAASLALVIVGGIQTLQSPGPGELGVGFRSGTDNSGYLQLEVEPTSSGWRLSWAPRENVDVYRVRVLNARGGTLLEQDVKESHVRIERSQLTGAESAELLFVRVEATDAQGRVIRSEPARLPATERP